MIRNLGMIKHVEIEAIDAAMKKIEAAVFFIDRHEESLVEKIGHVSGKNLSRSEVMDEFF